MKLHVKLLLYLLCSVTVVVTIAQVIQYVDTTGRLEKLTSEQIEMLAAREEENAQNVYHSIEQESGKTIGIIKVLNGDYPFRGTNTELPIPCQG